MRGLSDGDGDQTDMVPRGLASTGEPAADQPSLDGPFEKMRGFWPQQTDDTLASE